MKKIVTLLTAFILLFCFFPLYAQESTTVSSSTTTIASDSNNDKQMSDVMSKMKDMKMKKMGKKMMMMGVKMKMMGEYMSKSGDTDKGANLIKLGEQVFTTGKDLAGNPDISTIMKKGKMMKGHMKNNMHENAEMDD